MSAPIHYAEPWKVDRLEDCCFYHRMEIPGVGLVGGVWDLRSSIDDYLGGYDFRGRRAIDVGSASGFVTFAMESRGADVVSFDLADGDRCDLVPHAALQSQRSAIEEECRRAHEARQKAYWFAHRRLGSRARAYFGNIYDLPVELGPFDVAMLGMVLGHVRDPFQALYSVSRLVTGSMIISMRTLDGEGGPRVWLKRLLRVGRGPMASFMPGPDNPRYLTWWALTPQCLTRMLSVCGFQVRRQLTSRPRCHLPGQEQTWRCLTLVADRIAGQACLPASTSAAA